jgi:hypothetical protein
VNKNAPVLDLSASGQVNVVAGSELKIVAAATDADNDPVTLSVDGKPMDASFDTTGPNGTFTWTPAAADAGKTVTVTFKATDHPAKAASKTTSEDVAIKVAIKSGENQPPVVDSLAEKWTVHAGEKLKFKISATDPDGDKLRISSRNLPEDAHLSSTTYDAASKKWSAEFSWKPESENASKTYDVKFTVTDSCKKRNAHQVSRSTSIEVLPGSDTSGTSDD